MRRVVQINCASFSQFGKGITVGYEWATALIAPPREVNERLRAPCWICLGFGLGGIQLESPTTSFGQAYKHTVSILVYTYLGICSSIKNDNGFCDRLCSNLAEYSIRFCRQLRANQALYPSCTRRRSKASYRSELEICGYDCLDHHLEGDTSTHSFEVLADIISDPICEDMLIDLGLPVRHRNVRYNCRVLCTYKHIYMIRPKMSLAQDGLYREARHFAAWVKPRQTQIFYLEQVLQEATGQSIVPIGDAILSTTDTAVSCETREELFTPLNPSSNLYVTS